MKLSLEFYGALCATSEFVINGIEADSEDFGEQYDANPGSAEAYGCGNMVFEPILPHSRVLKKYNISVDEYTLVAERLKEGLSFGCCGWCA